MEPVPGNLYLLRDPYHATGLIKIGRTRHQSEFRAAQLSRPSGVPWGFEVMFDCPVPDMHLAERLVHERLASSRVNRRREFFRLPLKVAVRAVVDVAAELESISTGRAVPKLVVTMAETARPAHFVNGLHRLLLHYRGGPCSVAVRLMQPNARAIVELGPNWKIHVRPSLISALAQRRWSAKWHFLTLDVETAAKWEAETGIPF